uniref:Tyrosine-protein kinase n=1 Tax=Ascaris lumbricoides TaxID=6252 RepID=A0A0M3I561_ASCLU
MAALVEQVENYPFYHGFIPREELLYLLEKVGDFLIRIALRKRQNPSLVLSIRTQRENIDESIRHIMIHHRRGEDGIERWLIHEKRLCATLSDLIDCYIAHGEPVNPELQIKTSILLRGIRKQSWELDNDSVTVETVIGHAPRAVISEGRILIDGTWRTVIIKAIEIPLSINEMDETREQIKAAANEARILSNFEHTNIIKTYGIALLREPVLFVSETIANAPTLYTTLRRRRGSISDVEKVESMCLACARAVDYIHSRKCIHRCIGSRNVLYTADKLAKLCEFGLARTGGVYVLKKSQRVPLRWMAPESLAACTFTTKSDVFSFGIFLFEVFTEGKEPYKGLSSVQVKRMVTCGSRMERPRKCPDEIFALMQKCWEQNPEERCTMSDAVAVIERYLREISSETGRLRKEKRHEEKESGRDELDAKNAVLDEP